MPATIGLRSSRNSFHRDRRRGQEGVLTREEIPEHEGETKAHEDGRLAGQDGIDRDQIGSERAEQPDQRRSPIGEQRRDQQEIGRRIGPAVAAAIAADTDQLLTRQSRKVIGRAAIPPKASQAAAQVGRKSVAFPVPPSSASQSWFA